MFSRARPPFGQIGTTDGQNRGSMAKAFARSVVSPSTVLVGGRRGEGDERAKSSPAVDDGPQPFVPAQTGPHERFQVAACWALRVVRRHDPSRPDRARLAARGCRWHSGTDGTGRR